MVTYNTTVNCQQAEDYYYIYLTGDRSEDIPQDIIKHIDTCVLCQQQVAILHSKLKSLTIDKKIQDDYALLTNLELHFNYIDKKISCDIVKPFLPILATKSLHIHTKTPITDHIDKCEKCQKEFETICSLNLTDKQLYTLGKVLVNFPQDDTSKCEETQKYIDKIAKLNYQEVPSSSIVHICLCTKCREILKQKRQNCHNENISHETTSDIPCSSIKNSDIFDYAIPYGIASAKDQYERFRQYLASHLISCKKCMGKLNELDAILYEIAESPESGCVSMFRSCDPLLISDGEEVLDDIEEYHEETITAHKRGIVHYIKPLAAVAAVLIFAFTFFNTSSINATDIQQMYQALSKVKHVHIVNHLKDDSSVIDEMWVSPNLNKKITYTPKGYTLWDVNSEQIMFKDLLTNETSVINVEKTQLDQMIASMQAPWSLLPFNGSKDLPENAVWQKISDEDENSLDIYDLTWNRGDNQTAISYKLRCIIDADTYLPTQIEYYDKLGNESNYELVNFWEIEYLTLNQFEQVVSQSGF